MCAKGTIKMVLKVTVERLLSEQNSRYSVIW